MLKYIKSANLKEATDEYIFRQIFFCKSSNSYILRKGEQINDRVFKKHARWRSENAKDGYIVENDNI